MAECEACNLGARPCKLNIHDRPCHFRRHESLQVHIGNYVSHTLENIPGNYYLCTNTPYFWHELYVNSVFALSGCLPPRRLCHANRLHVCCKGPYHIIQRSSRDVRLASHFPVAISITISHIVYTDRASNDARRWTWTLLGRIGLRARWFKLVSKILEQPFSSPITAWSSLPPHIGKYS
jgi:hypothetical protein